MENRSCQYVERGKSAVCGKRLISAQRGKYFTVSMWKKTLCLHNVENGQQE